MHKIQALHSPTRSRTHARWYEAFRNEDGAFDLPSILVGVVVVGILTVGVLAAIFGVIPFAQDKGAQQDLDGMRTAEGVAKARDGKFLPAAELATKGYLPVSEKLASDTDAAGSCYLGVSLSGSGKLLVSSSSAPAPAELLATTVPGCVTRPQLKTLVEKVGGVWDGGDSTGSKLRFTPVVAPAGSTVAPAVVVWLNANLKIASSDEFRAITLGIATHDPNTPNLLTAFMNSAPAEIVLTSEEYDQKTAILDDPAVQELNAASEALKNQLMSGSVSDPDASFELHQSYVDSITAYYQAAVDGAPVG